MCVFILKLSPSIHYCSTYVIELSATTLLAPFTEEKREVDSRRLIWLWSHTRCVPVPNSRAQAWQLASSLIPGEHTFLAQTRSPERSPFPTSRLVGFRYSSFKGSGRWGKSGGWSCVADPEHKPILGRVSAAPRCCYGAKRLFRYFALHVKKEIARLPSQAPPSTCPRCLYPHSVHRVWSAKV